MNLGTMRYLDRWLELGRYGVPATATCLQFEHTQPMVAEHMNADSRAAISVCSGCWSWKVLFVRMFSLTDMLRYENSLNVRVIANSQITKNLGILARIACTTGH
jgi:hypothetical protein